VSWPLDANFQGTPEVTFVSQHAGIERSAAGARRARHPNGKGENAKPVHSSTPRWLGVRMIEKLATRPGEASRRGQRGPWTGEP